MLFTKRANIRPRSLRETVTLVRRYGGTDEYGMQALTDGDAVAEVPASVEMVSGYVKEHYYQSAEVEAYEVVIRYVCLKFEAVVWNGKTLAVDSVEDEGMRHRWLRVLCSRREDV